jgi:hypothetical protein
MTDSSFITPEVRRLVRRLQFFMGFLGFILLLIGGVRIGIELLGGISDVAEEYNPILFDWKTLILGGVFAGVGYFSLYAMAAAGAYEPPALTAIRYSLLGIALAFGITLVWSVFISLSYIVAALILMILVGGLVFWFWQQIEVRSLWQVFGQPIHRQRETSGILYFVGIVSLLILVALGLIYAVLTDAIELPVEKPKARELLYTTTFDSFNDEWDLPQGRQSADLVDGELVLTENSGYTDVGFYARLESRKFGDFDLRVRTKLISGDNDNRYGVIFRWRDFDNYYIFEISGDGYYRLTKVEDGAAEPITVWTPSEIVYQGQAVNEIQIIGKGDRFTFRINQQIARLCTKGENRFPAMNALTGECVSNEWQDSYQDGAFRQGKIGLSVGTTGTTDITEAVVISFDNLVLVGPS